MRNVKGKIIRKALSMEKNRKIFFRDMKYNIYMYGSDIYVRYKYVIVI